MRPSVRREHSRANQPEHRQRARGGCCARHVAVAGEPGLFRGKTNDRRQPAHQTIEAAVEHGTHCPPPDVVGRVAIEPVLADVEIEGRQVGRTKSVQCREHAVEIECLDRTPDAASSSAKPVQNPAVELGHHLDADRLGVACSRRALPTDTAAYCAIGGTRRCGASGSPGRCGHPRCNPSRPPKVAECRPRSAA